MRVAHIVEGFSELSETFIYDSITESIRQGVDAHVITSRHTNSDNRPLDTVYVARPHPKWHPQRLLSWTYKTIGRQEPDIYQYSIIINEYKQYIKNIHPDIVHSHFGNVGWYLLPVIRSLGIPYIVSFYGYDVSRLITDPVWLSRYKELANYSDAAIGISEFICQKLAHIGFLQAKIHKLHAGIDLNKLKYSDPTERFDGKNIHCLHVGRLVEKKAPLHLVKAFAIARKALEPHLNLHLTIVGDGPLRNSLIQTIHTLNIADSVEMLGAVPHNTVLQLFAQAHIYTQHCLTTTNGDQEGMGVSFAEASASGLPIISTLHNGIPEVVIHGESGYLVPEGDIEAMAQKLIALCKAPESWKSLGAAGRSHIQKNLSLQVETAKYIELLSGLVKSRSPE